MRDLCAESVVTDFEIVLDLPRTSTPLEPAEYQQLIGRVHEEVTRAVPEGSTVLVVSRGDRELIRFPNHEGWHFPRTAGGEYVGHHPAESSDAIAHLEKLRSAGASYIVFPSTAFWWFDYYPELTRHLLSSARVIVDRRDTCVIFAFEGDQDYTVAGISAGVPSSHLGDLVEALLPERCEVVVATGESGSLPRLGDRGVWRLWIEEPWAPRADGADLISRLEALRGTGARYLIVPKTSEDLVRANRTLRQHLQGRCRLVTRQRYVGTIYELSGDEHPGWRSQAYRGKATNDN